MRQDMHFIFYCNVYFFSWDFSHCVQSPKKQLPQIPTLKDSAGYVKSTGNLYQEAGNVYSSAVPSEIANVGYSRSYSGETFPIKRYQDHKSKLTSQFLSTSSLSGKAPLLSGGIEPFVGNESFSSDQSECIRPSPPRPHRARLRGGRQFRMYKSLSSSEDEVRSTPELSTEDDFDLESESISEKIDLFPQHIQKRRLMKPDEILDAKMRNFLAVS